MDTTALDKAYADLLDAADTVGGGDAPPPGEWNAGQVLAHVVLVTAATVVTASTLAAGVVATYDNRLAQDTWTLDHLIAITGGPASCGTASPCRARPSAPSSRASASPSWTPPYRRSSCRTARSPSTPRYRCAP